MEQCGIDGEVKGGERFEGVFEIVGGHGQPDQDQLSVGSPEDTVGRHEATPLALFSVVAIWQAGVLSKP
jgi:hypothetical protein